jgi:hypothetical protein
MASDGLGSKKSTLLRGSGFLRRSKATTKVSKTPSNFFEQSQDLRELYQELFALRSRVRRAERASEKRANVDPNKKANNRAWRNQLTNIQSLAFGAISERLAIVGTMEDRFHETPTRSDSGYSPMSGAKADLNGECPRTVIVSRQFIAG